MEDNQSQANPRSIPDVCTIFLSNQKQHGHYVGFLRQLDVIRIRHVTKQSLWPKLRARRIPVVIDYNCATHEKFDVWLEPNTTIKAEVELS